MTPAALAELVRSLAHDVLTSRGLDPAALPATVIVHPPRNPAHGDYVSTVALRTGKRAGVAPRELAGALAQALAGCRGVRSAEAAGPGFLNLRLTAQAQGALLAHVLAAGERGGAASCSAVDRAGRPEPPPAAAAAQYAHARLVALARHAADLKINCVGAQLELLEHQREGELIRMLGEFPRIVGSVLGAVAEAGAPRQARRLARYLDQVASAFHRFDGSCRVLPMGDEQPSPAHAARLALCQATRQVLAGGLGALGLSAPERM